MTWSFVSRRLQLHNGFVPPPTRTGKQHAPDHWDRSPGAQAAFRDWLRVRYNDDAAALQQAAVYRYTPVPNGKPDPLAAGLSETLTESLTPLFYVDDPTAISLAQLNDTGKIGAAVKRHPGWTAVYLSLSGGFTPRLLRSLAREAGITPYGPEDDATYASNGFLVIHALHTGKK